MHPNETARTWHPDGGVAAVQLFLSEMTGDASALVERKVAGFAIGLNLVASADWIEPGAIASVPAAVVQVDPSSAASIKRFQELAANVTTPLIAAAYEPPLSLVRALVRAGAYDVIALPLTIEELESALEQVRGDLAKREGVDVATQGKLVTAIKSVGGVGATALLTQLAVRFAEREAARGNETCIVDLDVQFGDVAFQLGIQPKLTLNDLLEAGSRLDKEMLRATTARHKSGLNVIAAPKDMLPIEGMPSDHLLQIAELATRTYSTVFVDLPTNWTNWSLSLAARSDIVLLITELSVAGLHRARRQLNLLRSQDLGDLDVRVIVNRYEKSQARLISPTAARDALGRDVTYQVANDFALMRSAIDRGVTISEIKRKSAIGTDIDAIIADIGEKLGSER